MTASRREDDHIATMFPAPRNDQAAMLRLPCRRLTETATLPSYQRQGDAGADLYSDEDVDVYASQCGVSGRAARSRSPTATSACAALAAASLRSTSCASSTHPA